MHYEHLVEGNTDKASLRQWKTQGIPLDVLLVEVSQPLEGERRLRLGWYLFRKLAVMIARNHQ